ncbi:MAG TPA: PAS domain S-box protein, partial [Paludibacter sp.]
MKIKQTDKTIFLVDDVVENLQLLTKMLTESGYRIRAAKTGKEAIASIQTEIPDLILLDVKLPDINGFEVCRLLKEDKRTHHVPVVFLSGLSDTADKLEGFSAGGVDYITKPFISEEVLIRVNTHIEMSSLRLELENVALNLKEKNKLLEEEAAERKLAAERLSESYRKLEDSQKTTVSILSDLQQEMNLRLKQEEALRQSEERFQLLFYKTNLCYQTLDSGGNILDVNSQWLDTFGFERDEVVGKWFGNFIAPEYLSCLKEHFASFKAHGHVQRDFEIMHKDGRSFFVTLEGSIECDFNGHFKQTHCVLQDVAESKRVNELLRRNREDFKELFDRAPVGYHELDAEGRIVRINETELEMLGYSLSEIVGEYLWKFAVNETVSYRSITSKLAGKPGKTDSYERDYIRKDGRIISVLVTDKILKTDDGKIIGIRSNVQDITEQKLVQKALLKSQSLFSQAFNGSPAPMTIASQPDGKYIEVNESFLRLTEYSHDEVIGKTGDSLNLIDSAESAKIFNHLKKTGYLHNVEVFARSKSGKTLRLLTSIENTELAGEACTLSTMLDITERVMAEEALRKSQIQHRAIIHTAMDGFWLVDKNGKILEANDSYSKMSKYSIQELLQMSVSDLEAIEKQEDIEQRIKRILDNGSDRFETRHKRKDGSLFDLEVSIQKQGDSDNVVAFFHDITARKQADDALRKSEEKFKKAFMTTPDCVNINRLEDGMYVGLNPGFTNIIGYTEQEILGKTSLEKSIWYDVADRKRWVAELNANGEIRNFETQFRTKNGNVIDGLVSASIIELDGVKHVISITRDITERKTVEKTLKESEEKFRNIFEYSIVGKSITSFDGKLSVNKAFSNIVGYSEKELSKLTWRDITYEDDIELKEKEIELLVKGVKKFTKFESRFVHKNGNIVWTDLSAVLQKDNDG